MTTEQVKRYRCEGCGAYLEEKDVLKFYATLAHEVVRYDGEPMPCGEVRRVDESQEQKGTV